LDRAERAAETVLLPDLRSNSSTRTVATGVRLSKPPKQKL
jgi:hypothetical protein